MLNSIQDMAHIVTVQWTSLVSQLSVSLQGGGGTAGEQYTYSDDIHGKRNVFCIVQHQNKHCTINSSFLHVGKEMVCAR